MALPILGPNTYYYILGEVWKYILMKIKARYVIKNIKFNPPGHNIYPTKY